MKSILMMAFVIFTSINAYATSDKQYDGRYIAKYVQSKTQEIARLDLGEAPAQQGSFVLYFVHEDWSRLSAEQKRSTYRVLLMRGTITGKVDLTTGLAAHILTNNARTGALFTDGDVLVPISGDYACSNSEVLEADEILTFIYGTGVFQNLTSGSVLVSGTANNCNGHPEFQQNTFYLANDESYLEFSAQ